MGPDPSPHGARDTEEPRRRRAIFPTLATRFHRRGGSLSRAGTGLLDHRGAAKPIRASALPPSQGPQPWPQATGQVPDERFYRPLDDTISRPRWVPRLELITSARTSQSPSLGDVAFFCHDHRCVDTSRGWTDPGRLAATCDGIPLERSQPYLDNVSFCCQDTHDVARVSEND